MIGVDTQESFDRFEKEKEKNTSLKELMKKCLNSSSLTEMKTQDKYMMSELRENPKFLHIYKMGLETYLDQSISAGTSICSEARAFINQSLKKSYKLSKTVKFKVRTINVTGMACAG
jgi:hypothetical protein